MTGRGLTRRAALAGGLIAPFAAGAAQAEATRRFTILRDGADIGRHAITLARGADGSLALSVDVEIVVRILGIAAYRYEMRNREVWRDGRLASIDSTVNDDGRRKRVTGRREGDQLVIDSDFYSGPAAGMAATTTYFTPDFLQRPDWISTDSGEPYRVSATAAGRAAVRTAAGPVDCARWRVTNGSDFDVTLSYDDRGEWVSVDFDAGGEPATYVADDVTDSFAAVWRA